MKIDWAEVWMWCMVIIIIGLMVIPLILILCGFSKWFALIPLILFVVWILSRLGYSSSGVEL